MDTNLEGGTGLRAARKLGVGELQALLAGVPFLGGLSPEVTADVAGAFELVRIGGDEQLLRADVPNDSLYVIVHGGLRLVGTDAYGGRRVISESYRGDSIGLVSLLPNVSAPADAYAIRDSILLRLTRARFEELGRRYPEPVVRVAENVARRGLALLGRQVEWTTWSRPGAAAQNLAVLVPSRDLYFARAAADLARTALEAYRRVGRATHDSVDAALGEGASGTSLSDARNEQVLAYLQGLEQGHEIVLYECDSTAKAWSLRCLRQADRVLAIVRADRPEHLEEIRPMLQFTLQRGQAPRLDVALVHPEQTEVPHRRPEQWGWLPETAQLHHVRMGNRADYERLARTLVRTGVAVVLSGGGARGIAHLGVLQALEDAKIPVDAIAGTSMGAIMAAGYARGWSASDLLRRIRELFSSRTALYDPTFPSQALLAGRKLERVLRRYFEGLDIEDLWLPFFCVSTNLSKAEARVHEHGSLWQAVAASCSIPGIFPPRREGDDRLVDGGVMNNLPIDLMASRFKGAVIASDVSPHGEAAPERHERGLRRLWGRVMNGRERPPPGPGLFEILVRSTVVGSQHTTFASLARGEADLYLSLPVSDFRMLEWSAHEGLFAAGYAYARQRLATWELPWFRATARSEAWARSP